MSDMCAAYNMEENFGYATWYAVCLSFGFWSALYLIVQVALRRADPVFCNRMVELFYGILMTFWGLNQCFTTNSPFENPEEQTNQDQALIIAFSLGHFLQDLVWCLQYQMETPLIVVHHAVSCIGLARMLFRGIAGHQLTCSLGALEITNPLLQLRWFSRMYGYGNTALFTSIDVTFIISFFVTRIFLGSIYVTLILLQPKNPWEFRFLSIVIYVTSWMFMINIGKYFKNKYLRQNMDVNIVHMNRTIK